MQYMPYGLSTDKLTPPLNLCSNAGSTHTSISQKQPLDMTLSMGILWSTMAKPVLNEPVLLNRCMVLATVLQLSFRVLAVFL